MCVYSHSLEKFPAFTVLILITWFDRENCCTGGFYKEIQGTNVLPRLCNDFSSGSNGQETKSTLESSLFPGIKLGVLQTPASAFWRAGGQ